MRSTLRRFAALALAGLLAMAGPASAQTFPSQPIRLIVPSAPGASTDILARLLSRIVQEQTGATVVVDNKAGGASTIGVGMAARSTPDGYTLVVAHPDALSIQPALRKDIPYKAERDLEPIAMIAETSWIFVVNPKVLPNVKTMKDLVDLGKAKPDQIKYASPGIGTSGHLVDAMLGLHGNAKFFHVPYNGAMPATLAGLSGEVDFLSSTPATLEVFLKDGKLRALAFTGAQRSSVLPDVPTMIESGFPDFTASAWFGIFAPAGLPAGRAAQLEKIFTDAMRTDEYQKKMAALGFEKRSMNRGEFAKFLATDSTRWRGIIDAVKVILKE